MDQSLLDSFDCQTCKLVYDFTQICGHKDIETHDQEKIWNELKQEAAKQASETNIQNRMAALKKVMLTLDQLSTIKELSYNILRGNFQDVLTILLRKDFVQIMGDSSSIFCRECAYSTDDEPDNFMISEHTLILLNRCLTHQLQAIITNNLSQLFIASILTQSSSN